MATYNWVNIGCMARDIFRWTDETEGYFGFLIVYLLVLLLRVMWLCIMGTLDRQQSCDLRVHYVTTCSENVMPPPNLHIYSFSVKKNTSSVNFSPLF